MSFKNFYLLWENPKYHYQTRLEFHTACDVQTICVFEDSLGLAGITKMARELVPAGALFDNRLEQAWRRRPQTFYHFRSGWRGRKSVRKHSFWWASSFSLK